MKDLPIVEAVEHELRQVRARRCVRAQREESRRRFSGWRRRLRALEERVWLLEPDVTEVQP